MSRLLWTQKQDMGPAPRTQHALAYDRARQRVVLFGGLASSGPIADTWVWNGELWTQVQDIGPSARGLHAMVYDAAREQVILFGGNVSPNPMGLIASGETWAWDGETWTQVADTGPLARASHAMAYDSVRQRVVLFSGQAGAIAIPDTWEWDGVEWTQVADTGPSDRADAAIAYDDVRARIVLFGGTDRAGLSPSGRLKDTWENDGTTWTRAADTGPSERNLSAMVFSGTRCVLFGGEIRANAEGQAGSLRDTWEWSGQHWTERQDMGPSPRAGHAMAYDSFRDRVVLFGGLEREAPGLDVKPLNDTWELPGSLLTIVALTFAGTTATVSLTGPAPIGGVLVALSCDQPTIVRMFTGVHVAEGHASASFPVQVPGGEPLGPNVTTFVTARLGNSSITSLFTSP